MDLSTPRLNYFSNISDQQNIINVQTPRIQYYSFSSNLVDGQEESIAHVEDNLNEQMTNVGENANLNIRNNEINTEPYTDIMIEEKPQPRIVNVVSMVELDCQLNLKNIAKTCLNAEYNPARINAVIMRKKEPKTAALVFYTGVIICTGANNEEDSKTAAKKYAKDIRNLGYDVKFKNFKIINIVATCDLKFNIHLTKLNTNISYQLGKKLKGNDLKEKISYEPQIFPGLIYRMDKPRLAVLVFASGKINFVGAKERDDVYKALDKIYDKLKEFKLEHTKKMETNTVTNKEKDFNNI